MQCNHILSFFWGAAPMNDPKAVVYLAIDTPYHNVHNFINLNKSKIKPSLYYKYLYIGNGNKVIDQKLVYGERMGEVRTIILNLS